MKSASLLQSEEPLSSRLPNDEVDFMLLRQSVSNSALLKSGFCVSRGLILCLPAPDSTSTRSRSRVSNLRVSAPLTSVVRTPNVDISRQRYVRALHAELAP